MPLRALSLDELRQRRSTKWRTYPDDVLPLFVAETDFPLAPAITRELRGAVERGDTGYTPPDPGIRDAYAGFARRRFGWEVEPSAIRSTGDVVMGVVELLRATIAPGDGVIVTPPVYPPFFDAVPEAGGRTVRVPLAATDAGWQLDLDAIETAFAAGARAMLLCSPHNPTGTVHPRHILAELAEIAARYEAVIISDEIHAPLTAADAGFTPYLAASDTAAAYGFVVTSASKAFNLAGLKCALMIGAGEQPRRTIRSLMDEVEWRTGLFGALAAVAAFSEESDAWLDAAIAAIAGNARLLGELLAVHLPEARYLPPQAGYLAWVDLRALGWGDAPAHRILKEARVALHNGPSFGGEGKGFVRVNLGCSPEVLTEAIARIGALARQG